MSQTEVITAFVYWLLYSKWSVFTMRFKIYVEL